MNKNKIKIGITILAISAGIAFGFSTTLFEFLKIGVLATIGCSIGYWLLSFKVRESEKILTLQGILEDADKNMVEMEEVINHYEGLLDQVSVKLPCVCGGNTFEGIFPAGEETLVECEKCEAKYKVMVSFDSILVSEPAEDLNISGLISKETEKHDTSKNKKG